MPTNVRKLEQLALKVEKASKGHDESKDVGRGHSDDEWGQVTNRLQNEGDELENLEFLKELPTVHVIVDGRVNQMLQDDALQAHITNTIISIWYSG